MNSDSYAILVLGGYRQTLSVLRSLGNTHELILGTDRRGSFVAWSKFVRSTWHHPPLCNPEAFFESLHELLQRHPQIRMIFPVGDAEILLLSRNLDRLPPHIRCVMPPQPVIEASQQKSEMFQAVGRLGIPTAAYRSVSDGHRRLTAVAHRVGFPCIIKPENETCRVFGKKAFIAITPEDLDQKLLESDAPAIAVPDDLIVQKYCVGGRRNIYFFADHGEVRASVEIAIDRTDQWDGTGYAVEGHSVPPNPQWTEHLNQLARSLNYHGAGCLQYLIDPATGDATFLEINARLGANFACALDCGLDLPRWWVQQCERDAAADQSDSLPQPADLAYPIGRRYTWLYGDLLGFKNTCGGGRLSSGQLLGWLASMARANARSRTHVTFRFSDPMPTAVIFADLLMGPPRRAAGRMFGRVAAAEDTVPLDGHVADVDLLYRSGLAPSPPALSLPTSTAQPRSGVSR